MREAVRVRMTKEAYQELRGLMSLMYNMPIVERTPALKCLLHDMDDAFTGVSPAEAAELVSAAQEAWGSDDIEVDDDAALSVTDTGVWVSGWLWVYRPSEDENDNE